MENIRNDTHTQDSLCWKIRRTKEPPRWPGDKESLLVILHGVERDHPDLQRIHALCEPEYDKIRVVDPEDFPAGEVVFLTSNFRYDVIHLAPRSALKSGLVKWE